MSEARERIEDLIGKCMVTVEIDSIMGDAIYGEYAGTPKVRRARVKQLLKAQLTKAIPIIRKEVAEEIFSDLDRARISGRQIVKIPIERWQSLRTRYQKQ